MNGCFVLPSNAAERKFGHSPFMYYLSLASSDVFYHAVVRRKPEINPAEGGNFNLVRQPYTMVDINQVC